MKFMFRNIIYYVDDDIFIKQGLDPDIRILTKPFKCMGETIPEGFVWNGASTPNGAIMRWIAPKFYRNLKASCLHDYLCGKAKCAGDRAKADKAYFVMKEHVEKDTSWKCAVSWLGVRVGAFFKIGSSY